MMVKSPCRPMCIVDAVHRLLGVESIWNFLVVFSQVAAVLFGVFIATAVAMLLTVAASRRGRSRVD